MSLPEELKTSIVRKEEILLEYQNTILDMPVSPKQLYAQACSNDQVTINSWRDIWLGNIKANHDKFGSFKDHSISKFYKTFEHQPCIIAGSGPSLKHNAADLKHRGNIPLVSCLHNFHMFEDLGIEPNFYVSLDAGDITIEEVTEGGKRPESEYWDATKKHKLICYIGTSPRLLEKWQGEVYFFNSPVPDNDFMQKVLDIEQFRCFVSNGGNVLGACLYFSRGFLGCNTIAYVGADFCFSYDKKFHPWDSKYDKNLGYVVKLTDVYGNKRLSWQSYANFKGWFEQLSVEVPGVYINCSEGGTLGAYSEGNIASIKQMTLRKFLFMNRMHEELAEQVLSPETAEPKLLF